MSNFTKVLSIEKKYNSSLEKYQQELDKKLEDKKYSLKTEYNSKIEELKSEYNEKLKQETLNIEAEAQNIIKEAKEKADDIKNRANVDQVSDYLLKEVIKNV